MARERINPNIRYYLPGDPYYYEVDNLPLQDLQANDASLQAQIDALNTRIDSALTAPSRYGFNELLPYWDKNHDGVLRVMDGNFISRVNTKATFENGLMERLHGSDVDSNSVWLNDQSSDEIRTLEAGRAGHEEFEAKAAARTAVIQYRDAHSLPIPTFDDSDFTDADAPDYRIDLLYIQASPSMDESNEFVPRFGNTAETARLGYVKGAYFRLDTLAGNDRNVGNILDSEGLEGKLLGLSQVDVYGRSEGTIPSPDDVVNGSWKGDIPAGAVSHTPGITTLSLDVWAENQFDNLGVFCLPVAYVKVPRGYLAGEVLPQNALIDIRPLFRSTELTLPERQAIATSHAPSLNNRFMTLHDADYKHFKDVVVKGAGLAEPHNHEGRIQELERKMRAQADMEVFQPVNISCMEGQEELPYYLDPNIENPDRLGGFRDFMETTGDWHTRRNNETYKKTVRAFRYKVGEGSWMLYTTIHFNIADEARRADEWHRLGNYTTETATREGDDSNAADLPMPSGYYRLNITELGYTGASVNAIIATPNMEMKWGGDAWAMDIFRHDDWVDPNNPEVYEPGFIDWDFGCSDTHEYKKIKNYPSWSFWRKDKKGWVTTQEGSMICSLTLIGLSTVPGLYEGAEIATDVIY